MRTILKFLLGSVVGAIGYCVYLLVLSNIGIAFPLFGPNVPLEWLVVLPISIVLSTATAGFCALKSRHLNFVGWWAAVVGGLMLTLAILSFG